jgi:hypothetical protein
MDKWAANARASTKAGLGYRLIQESPYSPNAGLTVAS